MNGIEHYREAERLLARAQSAILGASPREAEAALEVANAAALAAQVHATLALAASAVEPIHMWREALQTPEGTS